MTTFTIAPVATPDPTNLTVTGTLGGVTLKWIEPTDDVSYGAEVYYSATSNGTKTYLATVTGSSYYDEIGAGLTRYYWIRGKDVYGRSTGNWVGPVSGTTPGVTTDDIPVGAVSNTIWVSGSGGSNEPNTAAYPHWVSSTSLGGPGTPTGTSTTTRMWKVFSKTSAGSTLTIEFMDKLRVPFVNPANLPNNGNYVSLDLRISIWTVSDVNTWNTAVDQQVSGALAWVNSAIQAPVISINNYNGTYVIPYSMTLPTIRLLPSASTANWPVGTKYRVVVEYIAATQAPTALVTNGTFSSDNATLVITELKR